MGKYNAGKAWSKYNKHFFPNEVQCHINSYTCWHCGKENLNKKAADLHHIWPREMAADEDEWYNLKFLVVLCKQCHKDVHQRMYHYKQCILNSYVNLTSGRGLNYARCRIDNEEVIFWGGHLDLSVPCNIEAVITRNKLKKYKEIK